MNETSSLSPTTTTSSNFPLETTTTTTIDNHEELFWQRFDYSVSKFCNSQMFSSILDSQGEKIVCSLIGEG